MDKHNLPMPVSARYVRFHPTKRVKQNCLRVEIYGFASKPVKSKLVVTCFQIVNLLPGVIGCCLNFVG